MEGTYLALLPPELMEIVCRYLNNLDIYFCAENINYIRSTLNASNENRLDLYIFKKIFKQTSSLIHLTKLNLTGIHWVTAADIRNAIKKLVNIKYLYLFDTKMDLTKPNIKVYQEFKKMRELGLTTKNINHQLDPALTEIGLTNFFYHHKKQKDNCQLWKHFNIYYITVKQKPSAQAYGHKIYDGNWLQTAMELCTSNMEKKQFDRWYRQTAGIKRVDEKPFLGSEEIVGWTMKEWIDVTHLVIEPKATAYNIMQFNLKPIKYIPNLVKLDVHIMVHLGANFLELIFGGCPNLKFLKIKNDNAQMNLVHLKLARALEVFSYTTAYTLNLSRFFMEIRENPHIKLRRLFLSYGLGGSQLSLPDLSKFFRNNPQLHCFILVNEITLAEIKQIQEMLDSKITKHFQYFKVMKEIYNRSEYGIVVEDIPICHYDLFECTFEIARRSEFSIYSRFTYL